MKTRNLLFIFLLLALLLTSCQKNATPTATQGVSPTEGANPSGPSEPTTYPAPQQPAPAQPAQESAGGVLYPGPQTGDSVTWAQAYAMMLNSEVTKIVVDKALKASLYLKDGRTLVTQLVSLDNFKQVVQTCGDPCKNIEIVYE